MKFTLILILGLLSILLSSCIEGEEEIFLNADGSARVVATYRVPSMLLSAEDAQDLRMGIAEEVARVKNLKLITNKVEKHHGDRVIVIEIDTEDVASLEGALSEHDPALKKKKGDKVLHAIIGSIMVNTDGLKVHLNREIHLASLLDEYLGSSGGSILGESAFCYTVHLPMPVVSSNAHQMLNEGRTLVWSYKLADHWDKPICLSMTSRILIPWWAYALGGFMVIVLVWACFAIVARKRTGAEDIRV
ncbi:MAG: hypothetical protein ACPIA7_02270 [Akkermansiaceae bacterium]